MNNRSIEIDLMLGAKRKKNQKITSSHFFFYHGCSISENFSLWHISSSWIKPRLAPLNLSFYQLEYFEI